MTERRRSDAKDTRAGDSGARAVIVHDLAQARAAVAAAAALGAPVLLLSPPGAAAYLGAGYFKAMAQAARAGHPGARVVAVLDCGEAPGHALAALRAGVDAVCFRGAAETAARLADVAAQSGAGFHRKPPKALDLAGVDDPAAACRAWLGGGAAASD